MTASAGRGRRAREDEYSLGATRAEIFDHSLPFAQLISLRIESLKPDASVPVFDMGPEWVGNHVHPGLHGGVIAAALETVGGLALLLAIAERYAKTAEQAIGRGERVGTIDLRADCLQQG